MEVKVIDFASANAAQEFSTGLKEIGFAVIENHPIDIALIDDVYAAWEGFFSSKEKQDYVFDQAAHDGWVSAETSESAKGNSIPDIKEFYHYYATGRCPETLKEKTQRLYDALNAMAVTLLDWIEVNLPSDIATKLSMPLGEMIENSDHTLFRLIHYPPLRGDESKGALRAADHEDICLLTLLPAATAKGLQVKDSEGNWLDVPCNPGWIIVNIGDMLQECSEYHYPSTTHRVKNPEGEDAKQPRLSMPLFLHPRDEVVLSNQYTAKSYRKERFGEIGLLDDA